MDSKRKSTRGSLYKPLLSTTRGTSSGSTLLTSGNTSLTSGSTSPKSGSTLLTSSSLQLRPFESKLLLRSSLSSQNLLPQKGLHTKAVESGNRNTARKLSSAGLTVGDSKLITAGSTFSSSVSVTKNLLLKRKIERQDSNRSDVSANGLSTGLLHTTSLRTSASKKRVVSHPLRSSIGSQYSKPSLSASKITFQTPQSSLTTSHGKFTEVNNDGRPMSWQKVTSDFSFPEYNLEKLEIQVEESSQNDFYTLRASEEMAEAEVKEEKRLNELKQNFINAVSASLIGSHDFHDQSNINRNIIEGIADELARYDPEFILKLALYTRKELNIRTTANFLLAFASYTVQCRPFLRRYFQASVALPSDWIDVAEIYQTFHDKNISFGALPAALRKAMKAKFPDFDEYQLAKYNKDKKKQTKKEPKKEGLDMECDEEEEEEEEEKLEVKSFNLKELIRRLHITEPVEHVMCLIGKKYPTDLDSFYQSKLPGTFDPERTGKRMKLPTPETWETQVSMKGNKAETWETLIDHRKLPFMAMLRNLRNMISAGISEKHHSWVLKKLTDEGSVIHSKQFPFRFFSAYQVLDQMKEDLERAEGGEDAPPAFGRGRGRGRGGGRGRGRGGRWSKPREPKAICYSENLLNRYKNALDSAVKIATSYNVKPIRGKTLILCDVTTYMHTPCTSARGLGKPKTVLEVGILLGLMCKYSSEDCEFILCGSRNTQKVDLEQGTILQNMESVLDFASSMHLGESSLSNMEDIFMEVIRKQEEINSFVILSDAWLKDLPGAEEMRKCIRRYRHFVNRNMLFVNVALSNSNTGVMSDEEAVDPNDIYIAGFSDQILRFIAERGDSGQLNHVNNIDKAYKLQEIKVPLAARSVDFETFERPLAIANLSKSQRWHTIRVFISSTFRDMHGERDLLTRFVFPELRSRAKNLFINIIEVDLRWGVTEEDTKLNKSVEICLNEVNRCDYFLGMLGERYGYIPASYPTLPQEEFAWLANYPEGRSITELEVNHVMSTKDKDDPVRKIFFYFRDPAFIDEIPSQWRKHFEVETTSAAAKLYNLKHRICSSGFESFDSYSCHWGGFVDSKPITSGLEQFGQRVLNNVWTSVKDLYRHKNDFLDEFQHENALHEAKMESYMQTFVGRKSQLIKGLDILQRKSTPVLVISGKRGCGKSAFMSALASKYHKQTPIAHLLIHFVGAAPGSTHVTPMLTRISIQLKAKFALQAVIPEEYKNLVNKFPDILQQASVASQNVPILIFIDGIDDMNESSQPYNMEWLPQNIPQNIFFVVSVVSDGLSHKALVRRSPVTFNLGFLDVLDKSELVRITLAKHRKTLDESPFNNQLKLLVAKREANLPLFLSLACEELRMCGLFEEISDRLKSMSHTVGALLQEVIQRLEIEHGLLMVSVALVLLVCARDGLEEDELHYLLSQYHQLGKKKLTFHEVVSAQLSMIDFVPQAIFARLVRGLKSLLCPGVEHSTRLRVSPGLIFQSIEQRYLRGTGSDMKTQMHSLLAGFFYGEGDPNCDYSWSGKNPRALSELPFHLTQAGLFQELSTVLCSLTFIQSKCQTGQASQLPEDFLAEIRGSNVSRLVTKEREKYLNKKSLKEFAEFVGQQLHVIGPCPILLLQAAINGPSSSAVSKAAFEAVHDNRTQTGGLAMWRNKLETPHPCLRTLDNFAESVTCLSISPNDKYIACGTADCVVKLVELSTGKEVRSFIGHADCVTDCCFVGNSRLVSASRDGTLSLWDVELGHRVASMTGHRRQISSCRADKGGSMIASVSWDCTLRLWNARSGAHVTTITEKRPINCVAFHPEGRKVVTGSWDATLKIWDAIENKRVAILRGHTSSVRSVDWSPNGRYLASAAMDGTVTVWAADTGTAVGNLSGHSKAINMLRFSPSGRELVTASDDRKAIVWSGTLGKQILSVSADSTVCATSCVFSNDGSMVASGYHDGTICLNEVDSKMSIFEVKHHESRVTSMAWSTISSDLVAVLVGHQSGHVELLSEDNGKLVVLLAADHNAVMAVAYSSRNCLAAAAFEDSRVVVWRLNNKIKRSRLSPPVYCTLYAETGASIGCLDFSKDGCKLAAGTRDAVLIVWETDSRSVSEENSKKPLIRLYGYHKDWINGCAWSDNGDYLVTGSSDCSLKLLSIKTQKVKATFTGHNAAVTAVKFSHGCIVSSSTDGEVKVWSHRGIEITTLHGHNQKVNACDVYVPTEDGDGDAEPEDNYEEGTGWDTIVAKEEWKEKHKEKKLDKVSKVDIGQVMVTSSSDDGTCQVWKPLQGNKLSSLSGHADRVTCVAMASNGQVVSSALDKTVKIWNSQKFTLPSFITHQHIVTCVTHSPSGEFLLTTSRDGSVCMWKIIHSDSSEPAQKICQWKVSDSAVTSGVFISENRFILGTNDGVISSWLISNKGKDRYLIKKKRSSSLKSPRVSNRNFINPVTALSYNETDDILYIASWKSLEVVRGMAEGKFTHTAVSLNEWSLCVSSLEQKMCCVGLEHSKAVAWAEEINVETEFTLPMWSWIHCISARRNSNGQCVAGHSDGCLTFYSEEYSLEYEIHSDVVTAVDWFECPQGVYIVTGSHDNFIKLWEIVFSQTTDEILELIGQFHCQGPVTSLDILPQNISQSKMTIVCGDQQGNVYFLDYQLSV